MAITGRGSALLTDSTADTLIGVLIVTGGKATCSRGPLTAVFDRVGADLRCSGGCKEL
jgi:hypothetical protein